MPVKLGTLELDIILAIIVITIIIGIVVSLISRKQVTPGALSTVGENTSGQGKAARLPDEIKGWNFGAFFFTWIWGIGNNVGLSLLALISSLTFIMAIVLGVKGNEWAWRNRHWNSIEHFKRAQKAWENGAIALLAMVTIIALLVVATPFRLGPIEVILLFAIIVAVIASVIGFSNRKTKAKPA